MKRTILTLAAALLVPGLAAADDFTVQLSGNGQGFATLTTGSGGSIAYAIVTNGLGGIDGAVLRKGNTAFADLGAGSPDGADAGSVNVASVADLEANPASYNVVVTGPNGQLSGTLAKSAEGGNGGGGGGGAEDECPAGYVDYRNDVSDEPFCIKATITPEGGSPVLATEEPCLAETACFSGQLAGRSEIFVRVIGPRPNGFFWPTIVRFTPSRVTVEILRPSTEETVIYTLDAVPPTEPNLSGQQDREGFEAGN